MKILIIGASGKTGQKLLAKLESTHHTIVGLVRTNEQYDQVKQFDATPLLGDLTHNMASAVSGFDAIIFVAGSRGKNVQAIDYQGLRNTIDAATQARIKRFLYIGSINAGKEPDVFIKEIETFYHDNSETVPEGMWKTANNPNYHTYVKLKTLAEEYITQSTINYTILRAGRLTQEPGSGKVSVTPNTLNAFGNISRENVAACFIEVLENEQTYRKTYTILDGGIPIIQAFN